MLLKQLETTSGGGLHRNFVTRVPCSSAASCFLTISGQYPGCLQGVGYTVVGQLSL
jgi:hypothetical protein